MDFVYFRHGYTLDSVESILRMMLSFKDLLRLNKLELNTVNRHLSGFLDLLPAVLTQMTAESLHHSNLLILRKAGTLNGFFLVRKLYIFTTLCNQARID